MTMDYGVWVQFLAMPTKECPALCARPETDRRKNKTIVQTRGMRSSLSLALIQWPDILNLDGSCWDKYFTHHLLSQMSSSLVLVHTVLVDDVLGCRSWVVCQHVPGRGEAAWADPVSPDMLEPGPGWRPARRSALQSSGHFVAELFRIYRFIQFCIHPSTSYLL